MIATALWRRLDTPGFDACRLTSLDDGWRLHGNAVFKSEHGPTAVTYELECDREWLTRRGSVLGWSGAQSIDLQIVRWPPGEWMLNGNVVPLHGCVDLDFGFTPATNLAQLRRVALDIGQSADVPVAWIDIGSNTLERVEQRYARRSGREYWYESPRYSYFAMLEINASGFVDRYPELWEAVGED
jgi:hypothetical protein